MPKIPSFRRIFLTDYAPADQPLVSKLSNTINQGFETVYNALNRRISISDNIMATVKDVIVQVDASGIPVNPTSFQIDTTGVIQGCFVIKADNITNSALYPSGAPFISYTQTQNGIRIDNITGLQIDNQYRLRIVALG